MGNERALLEELAKIDAPTLANAIEKLDVRNRTSGFSDLTLRHLTPEFGTLCGYAVTAQAVTMEPEANDRRNNVERYIELCEALEKLPGPGVVVIQETGPHRDFAVHCGEVMATLFRQFGALGLVSDCAVRDLAEVRGLGFHLFARGLAVSHAWFSLTAVQVPVTVSGLRIRPGDLLHGDMNGLQVVPEKGRERLPALAAETVAKEAKLLSYLKSGGQISKDEIRNLMTH